jgi:biofilm PGA synthesis lipoprotein PgaB
MLPAVFAHRYDVKDKTYKSDDQYKAVLRTDLQKSMDEIRSRLGRPPRAIMWPYGEFTGVSDAIAISLGMSITFSLSEPVRDEDANADESLVDIPRRVMLGNPSVADLAWKLQHYREKINLRAVQVDLDYVYDPDPVQQEKNLSALLDRMKLLGVNQVWLQAFADPNGDGVISEVYFPSSIMPMRADLFSRAAWQLRTRCNVQVFAWMPVLSWKLPDAQMQQRLQIQTLAGHPADESVRLNPLLPETKSIVGTIYEDMSRSAPVAGILFNDDAVLRDTDALGQATLGSGAERTEALISFTQEMKERVQIWNPGVLTARNLFAEPVLRPSTEDWYAQSLNAFTRSYDEVVLMAMPRLEHASKPNLWLKNLVISVANVPGALDKTVFELQTVDWRTDKHVDTAILSQQMHLLKSAGALHLAYYPDDFLTNRPDMSKLAPVFSSVDFPVHKP